MRENKKELEQLGNVLIIDIFVLVLL